MATEGEDSTTSELLLSCTNHGSFPTKKKVKVMSSTYGIKADCVDSACLASTTSSHWLQPEYSSAPATAALNPGSKHLLLFGAKHCVKAALHHLNDTYSAGLNQVPLSLGTRVVSNLGAIEQVSENNLEKVMSARYCTTVPIACWPMLGIFASSILFPCPASSCRSFFCWDVSLHRFRCATFRAVGPFIGFVQHFSRLSGLNCMC